MSDRFHSASLQFHIPGDIAGGKDKNRYRRYLNTFFLHFRPRNVPERTLRFTLTWGLGGMAFVLVTLLIGTGIKCQLLCPVRDNYLVRFFSLSFS